MDKDEKISELEGIIKDLRSEIDKKNDTIRDCEFEKDAKDEKISDLENEISEYDDDAYELSLLREKLPDTSGMIDDAKFDLFCENFDKFTLEQFEQFLKTTDK